MGISVADQSWGVEAVKAIVLLIGGGGVAKLLDSRATVRKARLDEFAQYRAEVKQDLLNAKLAEERAKMHLDEVDNERRKLKEKLSDVKIDYDRQLAVMQRQIEKLREELDELRETLAHCPSCPHREDK